MTTRFGERIRMLRNTQKLLLRQVASKLQIDPSILSKIELGERVAKREQVLEFATILNANKDDLMTLWLADQIFDLVKNEEQADKALRSVSKQIKSKRK